MKQNFTFVLTKDTICIKWKRVINKGFIMFCDLIKFLVVVYILFHVGMFALAFIMWALGV